MIYGTALILGLFGSLHCVGMCGPLAMALPLTAKEKREVAFQSLLYQFGRVTTYAMMGLFLGVMGWGIVLSGYQKVISISLGVVLILSAIFSFSIERKLMQQSWVQAPYQKLKTKLGSLLSITNKSVAYKIGLLNGFLPCGLVYVALSGALLSGSIIKGGLYMTIFGLGTIPLMMAVMIFGKFGKKYITRFRNLLPIVLILFGAYLIFRGMTLEVPGEIGMVDSVKCH